MKKEPNLAGAIYLSLMVAGDYPEQEPAYKYARNYDLLWLLIPIIGIIPFMAVIESRYSRS